MRIIPAIGVMHGIAVQAVGGRRDEYKPLKSRITSSTDPSAVALAMLEATHASELYLADLDAIRGGHRNAVPDADVTILLDAGWRAIAEVGVLPSNIVPVLALESLEPKQFQEDAWRPEAVFSIDLVHGVLNGDWQTWGLAHDRDVGGLVKYLHGHGVRKLIVLDLHAVGTNRGLSTLGACHSIRESYPDVTLITGGGVRSQADLDVPGIDALLVASAIHNGISFRCDP